MNKIDLLKIQIKSDTKSLKEDIDAGLYRGRIEDLNNELEKIHYKEVLLEQLEEEAAILLGGSIDLDENEKYYFIQN